MEGYPDPRSSTQCSRLLYDSVGHPLCLDKLIFGRCTRPDCTLSHADAGGAAASAAAGLLATAFAPPSSGWGPNAVAPLKSGSWFLLRPDDEWHTDDKFDGELEGKNYTSWACPACCDGYTAGKDNKSRIVTSGTSNTGVHASGTTYDPECARVGDISQPLENEITLLKGATLKKEIEKWGQEVNSLSILDALKRLNDTLDVKLSRSVRAAVIYAADVKDEQSKTWMKRVFSTDGSLAIPRVGQEVKVLLFDNGELPVLGEDRMRDVVDFAATFLDLDSLLAKTAGKGTRRSIQNIQERSRLMLDRIPPPPSSLSIL